MNKILAIAWKELYTTFRDRSLILIMFVTPLVLSTIIGLAFGSGGDSDTPDFTDIPLAVVNLDEGFNLLDEINLPDTLMNPETFPFDLNDVEINLGDQLSGDINLGDQLASILLSESIEDGIEGTGFDIAELTCSLLDTEAESVSFEGTLDDLLDARLVDDPAVARTGVEEGEYAVAVIIPPGFSQQLVPRFQFEAGTLSSTSYGMEGSVEVYGNSGRAISARIVHSIVEGIVNQYVRLHVALSTTLETTVNTLLDNTSNLDLSAINTAAAPLPLQNLGWETLEPVGCLLLPGASNITVDQQPLDALQEGNRFARIIVAIGSSQAVFFALFTGVFGILSIYEERRQWTLQRLLVSPTPRVYILAGRLLGNLVIVLVQLLLLLAALTLVASVVIGEPTFVWGPNLPGLFLVTTALALCTSGLGVFVVGLARSQEQVQIFAPMINITLAVLGGSFGFNLPEQASQFSLIYWGVNAFTKLASLQTDIGINLLILFGQGIVLFLVGIWLFKRRMAL